MDRKAQLDALNWQIMIGADEAIGDEPQNHLKPKSLLQALPEATPAKGLPKAQPVLGNTVALAESANTLDELREMIRAYDGLEVKLTATNLVFADGNPEAKIMVIGEAPGSDEDRQGKPFVGVSGQLLDKMLGAMGFDRTSVYITNVLNWRPPGNRKPTPAEVALSLPFLMRHIELVDPKLILLSGDSAAKAVTGLKEGITRLRGKWQEITTSRGKSYPVLPTFHPAFLLRTPINKREAWQDILALKQAFNRL